MKLKQEIKYLCQEYNFSPQKYLSQNFLIDSPIRERIIENLHISREDKVLEIGAGPGILTEKLIEKAQKLWAVEIDARLCQILQDKLGERKNLEIICSDISYLVSEKRFSSFEIKVVGNLPYHIASSLLLDLAGEKWIIEMVVMVQREVGRKILARVGKKERGILTVILNHYFQIEKIIDVPPQAFLPPPRVGSTTIRFKKKNRYKTQDKDFFISVVKAAFSLRRKKLVNSLSSGMGLKREKIRKTLQKINISPEKRAEDLKVGEFVEITDELSKFYQGEGIVYPHH